MICSSFLLPISLFFILWGLSKSWVGPLVAILILELFLDLIGGLDEIVVKINIFQILIKVLLLNLELL